MPPSNEQSVMDAAQIQRCHTAARTLIEQRPLCWLATRAVDGGAHARAIRIGASPDGRDEWTRRFLCRRASRKVAELRADPLATLAYQDDAGDVFVALGGSMALLDDMAPMRAMWPDSLNALYPPGWAEANMIVAQMEVDRVEIHARGLTREPFGHGRTLLDRTGGGLWRYVPD